jgi:hypothetical protein
VQKKLEQGTLYGLLDYNVTGVYYGLQIYCGKKQNIIFLTCKIIRAFFLPE